MMKSKLLRRGDYWRPCILLSVVALSCGPGPGSGGHGDAVPVGEIRVADMGTAKELVADRFVSGGDTGLLETSSEVDDAVDDTVQEVDTAEDASTPIVAPICLCLPCHTDLDCTACRNTDAQCIHYGPAGSFCATRCVHTQCPAGYNCVGASQGVEADFDVCVRADGDCPCNVLAVEEQFETACQTINQWGSCWGKRHCSTDGLSDCTGATPEHDKCDGIDNDCDGDLDEDFAATGCVNTSVHGVCPGVSTCLSGEAVCVGLEAASEQCDGMDNDCDGIIDNGFADTDWDLLADCVDTDDDGDLVPDFMDNCPVLANSAQNDSDEDGTGDLCDNDDDNDGWTDEDDCAPVDDHRHPEAEEQCDGHDCDCDGEVDEDYPDSDHDKLSDCVDADDDNDGHLDGADCAPTEPTIHPDAAELCDGLDNNCDGDVDESFPDSDADGLADCVDSDIDGDEVPDVLDNCPGKPNSQQQDTDLDGIGDLCDADADGDGIPAALDNCPDVSNPSQGDSDSDGTGDACVDDADGDGVTNGEDNCPTKPNPEQDDWDGDAVGDLCDADDDDDGATDMLDCAPFNPEIFPGSQEICDSLDNDCDFGVDEGFYDSDNDGISDCADPDDDNDGFPDVTDCDPLDAATHPTAPEICNGLDDNCDGMADETLGTQSCGKGICQHLVPECAGGQHVPCNPYEGAKVETCDGLDDDCDGEVDELFAVGQVCTVGFGTCATTGFLVCSDDGESTVCDAIPGLSDCADKECGQDGCGGTCGICDDGLTCSVEQCLPSGQCSSDITPGSCLVDGQCRVQGESAPANPCLYCAPDLDPTGWSVRNASWPCGQGMHCFAGSCCDAAGECIGKQCGSDGCGGTCGECPEWLQCANGQCSCVPSCSGKECGTDGCGGTCGTCSGTPGSVCLPDGTCCVQQCEGKSCGWDGCGLGCGSCDDGLYCTQDACLNGECSSVLKADSCAIDGACRNDGELNPDDKCQACDTATSATEWSPLPDGTNCAYNPNYVCHQGSCCARKCPGWNKCGDDGCGGTCGDCPANYNCQDEACVCQPDCEGKLCGDDGCMGQCGQCGPLEQCLNFDCVPGVCSDQNDGDWDGCTNNVPTEFRINGGTVGNQKAPTVAALSSGGFVVVWEHRQVGQDDGEFRGRFVDPAGQVTGDDFVVHPFSGEYDPVPTTVAQLKSGRTAVVWLDLTEEGKPELRMQRVATDSSVFGEMMVVSLESSSADYPPRNPYIVSRPAGGFLVFYQHVGFPSPYKYRSIARKYEQDEVTPEEWFALDLETYYPKGMQVTPVAPDRVLVAWGGCAAGYTLAESVFATHTGLGTEGLQDETKPGEAGYAVAGGKDVLRAAWEKNQIDYEQLRLRSFDESGAVTHQPLWLHENWTLSRVGAPAIAGFPTGEVLVVWAWEGTGDRRHGIHAQLVDPVTGPLGNRLPLNAHTPYDQAGPVASAGTTGNVLVAWQSCPHKSWSAAGQDGDGCGIFGRVFSPAGVPCQPGQCDPTCGISCDDSLQCTDDSCVAGTGCVHLPRLGPCGQDGTGQCHLGLCCHADCAQQECGADGCGGSCGSCPMGETCSDGECLPDSCDDGNAILWDGCSYGNITEFRLSAENKSEQAEPCVVDLPGELFGAAWSGNGAADPDGVYMRRFAAGTGPLGSEVLLNEGTQNKQRRPRLARGSSRLLAVWESLEQDGDDWGIFARYFDFAGASSGQEFQLNQDTIGPQEGPVALCRLDDTCLVFFVSGSSTLSDRTLYVREVSPEGGALGQQVLIASKAGSGRNHDAVLLTDGGFLVAYVVEESGDNMGGIRWQRHEPGFQQTGPTIAANDFLPNQQCKPSIAILSDGTVVVAWNSEDSWQGPGGQDGHKDGVFARLFELDGTPLGKEFSVADITAMDQRDPTVIALQDGSFGVFFMGCTLSGTECNGVAAWRRFTKSGAPLEASAPLQWQTTWDAQGGHAVPLVDGGFLGAWQNTGQDGFETGVYAVRFNKEGMRLYK